MNGAGDKCRTILVTDAPTSDDAFGHARVAEAIADLITSEQGARTIGLVGNWGSGKSSVIEILKQHLKRKMGDNAEVFIFDAWAHQGDPLRRGYLEKMIDFLIEKNWISDQVLWKQKKEELARRTQKVITTSQPLLTPVGAVFAMSLLLLPLAFQLFIKYISSVGSDFYFGVLGAGISCSPLLFLCATWVFWRPKLAPWKRQFWTTYRPPNQDRSLLALFLNKTIEKSETNTVRTPDPTSVEFQSLFGELVSDALRKENRKLLIAVDNLDRIDTSDALAILATLRTFFDFDGQSHDQFLRLWLLIPFDERGIRRLWNESDLQANDELTRSFTEKTFQIKFRVSPPVLSDWHEFFKNQLKVAFPDHGEDDFHLIYRIYDLRMLAGTHAPTPREMKLFINSIGALHRQWKDDIPLPVQALYT